MNFQPPLLLRNPHLQSICASTGPRRYLVQRRARELRAHSRPLLLDCGAGVRLLGELSAQPRPARAVVALIHGWEGSADSLYLLSAGAHLFAAGCHVLRLNLRDHGATHHLNPELFNSTRIDEVVGAIKALQQRFAQLPLFLVGFSLGGNFVLRAALRAPAAGIALRRAIAVCPVLDPVNTMANLETGWRIYHDYFRRKWRHSLRKKLHYFPELGYGGDLLQLHTLRAMNDYFVPRYTHFPDTLAYLRVYSIVGDVLQPLTVPSHIFTSSDVPVIHAGDLAHLARNEHRHIEVTRYGGHCGFIENYRLQSWVDRRLVELLLPPASP
jgi:predicted alpha/beta-fold hydrolase